MSYLTLAYVRQTLWNHASKVAYATATSADKLEVDGKINQVSERFITSGNWRGMLVRARFAVIGGQFTLPNSLATVMGATPRKDDRGGASVPVRTMWHDLISSWCPCDPDDVDGCAYQPCHGTLTDLGDGFATFRESPYTTFYVRVRSDADETGKTILLRGLDANGVQIYQADGTEGVSLAVDNSAVTTSQVFSYLGYWVKSAATLGLVRLWAVDVETAEETLIGIIAPSKTVSGYRRYGINTDADEVDVIAKRAYVPAVSDNDMVVPSHLGALKRGLQALQYEDKADDDRAEVCWQKAHELLELEREAYDGYAATNQIRFSPSWSAGDVLNLV